MTKSCVHKSYLHRDHTHLFGFHLVISPAPPSAVWRSCPQAEINLPESRNREISMNSMLLKLVTLKCSGGVQESASVNEPDDF